MSGSVMPQNNYEVDVCPDYGAWNARKWEGRTFLGWNLRFTLCIKIPKQCEQVRAEGIAAPNRELDIEP